MDRGYEIQLASTKSNGSLRFRLDRGYESVQWQDLYIKNRVCFFKILLLLLISDSMHSAQERVNTIPPNHPLFTHRESLMHFPQIASCLSRPRPPTLARRHRPTFYPSLPHLTPVTDKIFLQLELPVPPFASMSPNSHPTVKSRPRMLMGADRTNVMEQPDPACVFLSQ